MPTPLVHWHEGLFLLPQHFQLLQRGITDQFGTERRLSWAYPYGVIEARLSHDDLENFRIRFDRLQVVMPGGIHLSYPENTDLPSLDIREAFAANPKGFTVYLGLPHWFSQRANTLDSEELTGARVKIMYRVARETVDIPDENTGQVPRAFV